MDNDNYILIFTIGPVQSFIAQARKTRDLYTGSLMLSGLIKEVSNEAIKTYKAIPIFPDKSLFNKNNGKQISSFPNRFLMFINDPNAGQVLKQFAKRKFRSILVNHLISQLLHFFC